MMRSAMMNNPRELVGKICETQHQAYNMPQTVAEEVSFEFDDIGFGESDDEVGDDEQPKGTGR